MAAKDTPTAAATSFGPGKKVAVPFVNFCGRTRYYDLQAVVRRCVAGCRAFGRVHLLSLCCLCNCADAAGAPPGCRFKQPAGSGRR